MVGFNEWSRRYAATFSLHRDEDSMMLAEWESVFDKAGFTADDLNAATDELTLSPPQTRGGHLKALVEVCRRLRSDRLRHRPSFAFGDCNLCDNLGSIEAPHPAYMRDPDAFGGRWRCVAIACMCERGRAYTHLMNVEAFDRAYPNWRDYLRERRDEKLSRMGLLHLRDNPDALLEALEQRNKLWRAEAAAGAVADASQMPRRQKAKGPPPGVSMEDWLKKQQAK